MVERSETTEYSRRIDKGFTKVRAADAGCEQLPHVTNPHPLDQRRRVLNCFNSCELIAIGVKKGIPAKGVRKSCMRATVVRDWFAADSVVGHIRTPTPDSGSTVSANMVFSESEALAQKRPPEVRRNLPLGGKPTNSGRGQEGA